MKKGTSQYLSNDELMREWQKWKETGNISERMGTFMLTLANHIMQSRSFNGYNADVKDEIVSESVLKIMKNLKNFNPSKGTIFNYWTRCVFTAATVYLAKYYRDKNKRRQLLIDALNNAQISLPPYSQNTQELIKALEQQLREYESEPCDEMEE